MEYVKNCLCKGNSDLLNSSISAPSFSRMKLQVLTCSIHLFYLFSLTNAVSQLELFPGLQCSYNLDLEVHTHRGKRSTKELNFKMNGQVRCRNCCDFSVIIIDANQNLNELFSYSYVKLCFDMYSMVCVISLYVASIQALCICNIIFQINLVHKRTI